MKSRYDDDAAGALVQELAPQTSELLALRTYSARLVGSEPSLVLHGGGNTSVKATATTPPGRDHRGPSREGLRLGPRDHRAGRATRPYASRRFAGCARSTR